MTYGRIATLARQWSRVDSVGISESEIYSQINEAVAQFALDVHGLPVEDYLTIAARFDMRTTMAFNLTMTDGSLGNVDTDIDVTDVNADDQTGTEAATELQTQIQAAGSAAAGVTVTWSNYKFTIGNIAATTTALTITAPDAVDRSDATEKYFGGTYDFDDVSASAITCAFPEAATMIADLPTGVATIQTIDAVYWDDHELRPIQPRDIRWGEAHGEPWHYARRGELILLYPSPIEQEECLIYCRGIPADVSSPTSASNVSTFIPARYQRGVARLVASWLAESEFEHQVAVYNNKEYLHMKNTYIGDFSKQITINERSPASNRLWYRVSP